MADHYFAVTGSGSGTGADADNPQTFSTTNLNTAESAASSGDTIFFLPGNYSLTSLTLDGPSGITYKSTETHGAVIDGTQSSGGGMRVFTLGTTSTDNVSCIGFKFIDYRLTFNTTTTNPTPNTFKFNKVEHTTNLNGGNNGIVYSNNGGKVTFTDNVIYMRFEGGARFWRYVDTWTIDRNTIHTDLESSVTGMQTDNDWPSEMKNNIWISNGSSAWNSNATNDIAGHSINSCFYNIGTTYNTSGGTNNVFADPQFVDPANGDYRLRPSSPCIGAGTAS